MVDSPSYHAAGGAAKVVVINVQMGLEGGVEQTFLSVPARHHYDFMRPISLIIGNERCGNSMGVIVYSHAPGAALGTSIKYKP